MKKFLINIAIILLSAVSVTAQSDIDFDRLMNGMQTAQREKPATSDMATALSSIEQSMVATNAANDAAAVYTLDRLTQAMTANASAISAVSNATASISRTASYDSNTAYGMPEYSERGIDNRRDMAAHKNRFSVNQFYSGPIYAAPAGRDYIDLSAPTTPMHPVPGALTSGYGWRPNFGRMHYGVDLALSTGDTVRAALPGRVVLVSNDPDGYGRYVKVQHEDGMETLYAHLTHPTVKFGQQVNAGTPIGIGGATGNATGPHLHFETRLNGHPVNPQNFFDFANAQRTVTPRNPKSTNPANSRNGSDRKKPEGHSGKESTKATLRHRGLQTETITTVASNAKPRTDSYKVRRGDTLEKIARDYGMTVSELCRLNKMSPHTPMYKGKVLRLK